MADINRTNHQEKEGSVVSILLRLFWMFLGNMVLGVSALLIVQTGVSLSLTDIIYWAVIPMLVAARYLDVSLFNGTTSYGEPASIAHWRQYTLGLVLIGGGAWLVAHGAGYLLAK